MLKVLYYKNIFSNLYFFKPFLFFNNFLCVKFLIFFNLFYYYSKLFRFNNLLYFKDSILYFNILLNYFLFLIHFNMTTYLSGYLHYKFFIIIGLGFKKKSSCFNKDFYIFVGGRHWVKFFILDYNFYFNIWRKNLVLFTETKNNLNYYMSLTKYLRKETVFKTKGIMTFRVWVRKRIPRSILFARRIKFRILKLKLSKKQKVL